MTDTPQPSITINVDVTNPGQFFACCGLLELADRLWPGAEVTGGFASPRFKRSRFCIFGGYPFKIRDIMKALVNSTRISVDPHRPIIGSNSKPVKDPKKIKPISFGEPISLRLSWWLDELAGKQTAFKMWGAHQTSEGLLSDMAQAICVDAMTDETVLHCPSTHIRRPNFLQQSDSKHSARHHRMVATSTPVGPAFCQ